MSLRLTLAQLRTDPTDFVLEFQPGSDPALPAYIDAGEVHLTGVEQSMLTGTRLQGLVAFSFPGRCIVRDRDAEGGDDERYRSVGGHFVVVLDGEGEQVFAEHTGAGSLHPTRHEDVRTHEDVERSLEADERLPDASGALK